MSPGLIGFVIVVLSASDVCAFCFASVNAAKDSSQLPRHLSTWSTTTSSATFTDSQTNAVDDDDAKVPHHTGNPIPSSRRNLFNRLTFSWANGLMKLGNIKRLEVADLWTLEKDQQMHASSSRFHCFYEQQKAVNEQAKTSNILQEYWKSPLTRAICLMYKKEFIISGIIKLINSSVQFLPSLLVSRLLKSLAAHSSLSVSMGSLASLKTLIFSRRQGLTLACLLFLSLMSKTIIENIYFDMVTRLAAQVKGTLSAAIFQKALALGPQGRANVTMGEIVNLMQIDTNRLEYVAGSIHTVYDGLFQIIGYTSLLLYFLGPAVFAGIAAMLVILPLNAIFLQRLSEIRESNLKATDGRVKLTNEIIQGIRAIKSYNWETPFASALSLVRSQELTYITAAAGVRAVLVAVLSAAPSFVAVFSLGCFSLSQGGIMEPAKVFTALGLFNQLRFPLTFFPMLLNSLMEGKISLNRLDRFFKAEEVQGYVQPLSNDDDGAVAVVVDNASFAWTTSDDIISREDGNRGQLSNINLCIKQGELVAIIGPTGSGKSSLLAAILGELRLLPNLEGSRVGVNGKISYVPQSSWIPNDSLQQVILFGQDMNSTRYTQAIHDCGLTVDLSSLPAGDRTEIGERGVNLSGGQKQRLSMARAIYSPSVQSESDIFLLDDPLSALDSEVGAKLFKDCILGSALQNKTRVLVTHNLQILPEVDRIIIMSESNEGCTILDQGSYKELQARGRDLSRFVKQRSSSSSQQQQPQPAAETSSPVVDAEPVIQQQEPIIMTAATAVSSTVIDLRSSSDCMLETTVMTAIDESTAAKILSAHITTSTTTTTTTASNADSDAAVAAATVDERSQQKDDTSPISIHASSGNKGQLMTLEERGDGPVGYSIYKAYFSSANRPRLLLFIVLSFMLANTSSLLQQWVVAAWTSDLTYAKYPMIVYLMATTIMATNVAIFTWLRTYLGVIFGAAASKAIHEQMTQRVLHAPLSYFESTPVGRLLQRFSKDLEAIDQQLAGSIGQLLWSSFSMTGSMIAICLVTPAFAPALAAVIIVYFAITNYYRPVARELKRLDSLTRSPIYSHFSEALAGLPVIRAFDKQSLFRQINEGRLDDNLSAFTALKIIDRWLSFRLESLGNVIVFAASALAVLNGSKAGSTGLSLTNALGVTGLLNWAVRNAAETESLMNSVERVYFTINGTPQEAASLQSSDQALLDQGWPSTGAISFKSVVLRYRPDLDPVLRGVTLDIKAGERLGIVGRTGSGKSSLLRALQRLSEVNSGQILVDGIDLSTIGLDTARSAMSIIPQDPALFSASVRFNVDPFCHYSDEEITSALVKSGLSDLLRSLPGGLDYMVSEGGDNFSAGQRQLLCLARALVRRNEIKILLLDEATSSVDYATDALIQRTIRKEFAGCTVLTIAHRLDTIMDADRIAVMEAGRLREFAPPQQLLRDGNSHFSRLVRAEQRQVKQQQQKKQQQQHEQFVSAE